MWASVYLRVHINTRDRAPCGIATEDLNARMVLMSAQCVDGDHCSPVPGIQPRPRCLLVCGIIKRQPFEGVVPGRRRGLEDDGSREVWRLFYELWFVDPMRIAELGTSIRAT
jgi:hypothetical protein